MAGIKLLKSTIPSHLGLGVMKIICRLNTMMIMLVYMIMFITKVQEGLRYSDLPDASLVTRTFKTWSYFSLGFSLGLVAVFMIVVPLLITSTHFSLSGKGNHDYNFFKYLYLKLEEYACIMESQIFLRWTFSEFKSFSNPNHTKSLFILI